MYEAILGAERRLRESYEQDVGLELAIADRAEALLAVVLDAVGPRTGTIRLDQAGAPVAGDVVLLKLAALQYLGARALRVMRAARATLAAGYEAESRPHDRILVELLEHRTALLADPTGRAAKAWIEGSRGQGVGRRVAAMSPKDMYADLCKDSHGDPRPLARLLNRDGDTLLLEPQRTAATKASLLMHAGFARDQAVAIATFAEIELRGVDELDAAILAGWKALDVAESETP